MRLNHPETIPPMPLPIPGKIGFHETGPWCQKGWGPMTYILFHILFHYGLSQDIEYSFLNCAVGPCCLSILYVIVYLPHPASPLVTINLFSMSVSLCLFCK